jgi:hypothetical protein
MTGPRWTAGLLLAALAVCVAPGGARAQFLVVRNETPAPLVVQATGVVKGVVVRDRPYLLAAGDLTPPVRIPANVMVTVYDARVPNRVLGQTVIHAGRDHQFVAVLPDLPPKVRFQARPVPRGR